MQETVGIVQKDDGLTRLFRELRIERDTGARTAVAHLIETFGQGTSQRALGRSLRDGTMYEILRSDGIELVNWIGDPKFLFTSPIATDRKVNALVYGGASSETGLKLLEWAADELIAQRDHTGCPIPFSLEPAKDWFTNMVMLRISENQGTDKVHARPDTHRRTHARAATGTRADQACGGAYRPRFTVRASRMAEGSRARCAARNRPGWRTPHRPVFSVACRRSGLQQNQSLLPCCIGTMW